VSAAILVGAFTIHGVTPGPRMFETHARLVYGVYGAMLVASIFLLVVGRFGLIAFAKLTRVPATIIIPVVIVLCIVGAYIESRSVFAVQLMIGFAIVAYVMHRFGYSRITFLIGFIVGPLFELSLRQSLILLHGSPAALLNYPFAIALMLGALVTLVLFVGWPQRTESA
jgi:putative tricarboxylic transport membrane protein